MLVTLICKNQLYGVFLPEKVRGKYWIEDKEKETSDPKRRIFSIEAEQNNWVIYGNKALRLYVSGRDEEIDRLVLEVGNLYVAELSEGKKGYIFTEPFTNDRCTFKKYLVKNNITVNIGTDQSNQIVIRNKYVSSVHAQLSHTNGKWMLYDNNSKNGVYINERRLYGSAVLSPGDCIYILGVKLIIGDQFFAVNNPDGVVELRSEVFTEYVPESIRSYELPEDITENTYYRSPRFERKMQPLRLKIDAPVSQEKGNDTPLALSLAPSLIMGTASFTSAIVTVINAVNNEGNLMSTLPSLVMAVSMLVGMVVCPLLMKRYEIRRKRERELLRREKYLKYLENVRAEIRKASVWQRELLEESYPYVLSQIKKDNFFDMMLWSRVIGRKNFLTMRLGVGNIPLNAELNFPEQRFSIDDDVMRDEVIRLSEEKQMMPEAPVVYSLLEHRVSGIVGSSQAIHEMLNNLLLQLGALHSYDEVKLVFICDACDLERYEYTGWMQHIWDNEFRSRYLATNSEEVRDLSAEFARIIERRRESKGIRCPHYVIISTSKTLSDSCAFLADILSDETIEGFSYLAAYDELKNLPKECTAVIQVGNSQGMLFDYRNGVSQINFTQDMVAAEAAARAVMEIAEYRLDLQGGKYVLPGMLTFLDMFRVGKYEHLNVATRWRENNSVVTLQTPVGVNSDGSHFYLDLHENAHGPHGLVAGMTGSGKSEFIITFILSLAVNYSPDDVAFILIDYKGGGLVGAFDNEQYRLPHLSGTITNLDGASITRSLLSIQSELRRRQRIFNEARQISNEGTMDIYKYQKLYREGEVSVPLPHLLIISDEFAELKSQQPEFMDQLISTARIGRSLGVHLILATQKPSGVVNDQIWANSKFKVCLKVQDRADSMDMLKRPDAAELVDTGRFFLQVGYNELFEIGQSAWSGAPYIPKDTVEVDRDERVQMIDHRGNVIDEAKPQRKIENTSSAKKQIVEVAQYIARIAKEEQIKAEPLWLPEIPAIITIAQLEKKYCYQKGLLLNPVIGEYDIPFDQNQKLLTLPLSEKGNALCYGVAGSGKELFLTSLLYSLYQKHSSEELHTYLLDFGAETLRMFEEAPQTGGVAVSGEDEKIRSLFRYLRQEMIRRKKLFAEMGEDYLTGLRQGKVVVPGILVVINNYTNFEEQYESLDNDLVSLTRDCTKYGIYFVMTCMSYSGIRYKLQQNFPQVFVLQQNEKTDYVTLLGNTEGVYPTRLKGRGIFRGQSVYEFQTAHVSEQPERTTEQIKEICRRLSDSGMRKAVPIPLLPRILHQSDLGETGVLYEKLPVGLASDTIEPVFLNLKKERAVQILAMDRADLRGFTEGTIELVQKNSDIELFVFDPGHLTEISGLDEEHYIDKELEAAVVRLFQVVVDRHNAYKRAGGQIPEGMDYHPVAVFFVALGQIKKLLSEDGVEKLKLILERNSGDFRIALFAADDHNSANFYCTEQWCVGDGIWIGNGLGEQNRLKIPRGMFITNHLDFTSGFLIRKGMVKALKLVVSDSMYVEEEDE